MDMNFTKVPLLFEVQVVINEPNAPKLSYTMFLPINDNVSCHLTTFRQYLMQNIGISGNIPLLYVDDDNDQIPIDSEDEFKEAIEFARQRSAKGEVLMLIIDISKSCFVEIFKKKMTEVPNFTQSLKGKDDTKHVVSQPVNHKRLVNGSQAAGNGIPPQISNPPPQWFIAYMEKFKAEILADVKDMIKKKSEFSHQSREPKTKRRPKRQSEDESSDNQQSGSEPRNCKILRKLEKLQKREKKLELKLDQRIEKMESKKKRMLEKVSQIKTCKRKSVEGISAPHLMGGCAVKPFTTIKVTPYKTFSHIWELKNDGTIPWTDATELRLVWVSAGLKPATNIIKCPPLAPGELGVVPVQFSAPGTCGTYHSYWHFFHMGQRFGHWIVCTVVVATFPHVELLNSGKASVTNDRAEDLTPQIPVVDDSGSELELCSNESESDSTNSFVVIDLPRSVFTDVPSEAKGSIPIKVRSKDCKLFSKAEKIKSLSNSPLETEADETKNESDILKSVNKTFKKLEIAERDVANFLELNQNDNRVSPKQSTGLPLEFDPYFTSVMRRSPPLPSVYPSSSSLFPQTVPPMCNVDTVFPSASAPMYDNSVFSPNMITHPLEMSNYYYYPPGTFYPIDRKFDLNPQAKSTSQPIDNYPVVTAAALQSTANSTVVDGPSPFDTQVENVEPTATKPNSTTIEGSTSMQAENVDPTAVESNPTVIEAMQAENEVPTAAESQPMPSQNVAAGEQVNNVVTEIPSNDPENATYAVTQILPETLVNGAISVASKAYTTAQTMFSGLRSRPGIASDYDPALELNLVMLCEMGFLNVEKNVEVLKSVGNNIERALPILLNLAAQNNQQ